MDENLASDDSSKHQYPLIGAGVLASSAGTPPLFMNRLWVLSKLLLIGCLLASAYGVVHDQVSYTLSPEYYTRFKFIQFHTAWGYEYPRLAAVYIGVLATWWMGAVIAVVMYSCSDKSVAPAQILKNNLRSFFQVFLVAVSVTAVGLWLAYHTINENSVQEYRFWLRPGVTDPIQFVRVGYMHNASYLGGLAGMCVALMLRLIRYYRYRVRHFQHNK